jgi:hypothetical protein
MSLETGKEAFDDRCPHDGVEFRRIDPLDGNDVALSMIDQRPQAVDIKVQGADGVAIDLYDYPDFRGNFFGH